MARPEDLPDFDRPPITEVAVSVQFEPLVGFGFAEIGPLWDRFRSAFPRIEYQPRIPPSFETFGLQTPFAGATFQFQLMSVPIPRIWLLDEKGDQLIQFQPDRLIHNWRKVGEGDEYPRYERIRETFFAEVEELTRFVKDRGLGELVPNQCELTYVNQFAAPNGFGEVASEVLRFWRAPPSEVLGRPEDVALNMRFAITEGGSQVGRLYAQLGPAFDAAGGPIVQLTLIGRGPPTTPSFEGVASFLDVARDRIVRGFADLTSSEMHDAWQRRA